MAAADSKRDGGNGARYGEMARKARIVTGNGRERKRENRRAHTHTHTPNPERTNRSWEDSLSLSYTRSSYSSSLSICPSLSLILSLSRSFLSSLPGVRRTKGLPRYNGYTYIEGERAGEARRRRRRLSRDCEWKDIPRNREILTWYGS